MVRLRLRLRLAGGGGSPLRYNHTRPFRLRPRLRVRLRFSLEDDDLALLVPPDKGVPAQVNHLVVIHRGEHLYMALDIPREHQHVA